MKKWIGCLVICLLPWAAYAQKNLLPAARAALGKTAKGVLAGTVQEGAAAALTKILPVRAAWNHSSRVGKPHRVLPDVKINLPVIRPKGQAVFMREDRFLLEKNYNNKPAEQDSSEAMKKFQATIMQIDALKKHYQPLDYNGMFESRFVCVNEFSPFAMRNNELVLANLKKYIEQLSEVYRYFVSRPNGVREYGKEETANRTGTNLVRHFKNKKLIFLGEYHYFTEIQQSVAEFIVALKRQMPKRRVVVFSEFVSLPERAMPTGQTLYTYYASLADSIQPLKEQELNADLYAQETFRYLLQNQIEVYPLEDEGTIKLLKQEEKSAMHTLLAAAMRNKVWARIIERKMAEIRKTDPNALFIVYAGLGHTSWQMPFSMPKFFAKEKPSVVEFVVNTDCARTTLYNLLGENDPLFVRPPRRKTLFYWTEKYSWNREMKQKLIQNSGFNYLLIVPVDPGALEKRFNEMF